MSRLVALFALVAVAMLAVAAPASGAPAAAAAATQSNTSFAPGAALAGVVDVHAAEVGGALASRSFDRQVARARTNESRATVVAAEVGDLHERLGNLSERRARLEQAYANGTVSRDQYEAQLAGLTVRSRVIEHRLNRTNSVAATLPRDVLEARGVNTTALETLRSGARNLTGPEVSAIAHAIAGPDDGFEPPGVGERDHGNYPEGGPPTTVIPTPPNGTERSPPGGEGGPQAVPTVHDNESHHVGNRTEGGTVDHGGPPTTLPGGVDGNATVDRGPIGGDHER